MPASDLKVDIRENIAQLEQIATQADDGTAIVSSKGELALMLHLQHTLWPFLDGLVDQLKAHEEQLAAADEEIEELGSAVDDLTEERGSVLMPDEAGVFALLIQLARNAIQKNRDGQVLSSDECGGLELACNAAEKTITDTTINVDIDSDDDDGDDEGDDDGDDD